MSKIKKIKKECEPIVEDLGYDLVDVEYSHEQGSNYLRFFIGKRGGVTIDDCQEVSKLVGDKLDELDLIDSAYYLEVSSPGLDRPLKTDRDLYRNIGYKIEISLYRPIDGQKKIIGELVNYDDEKVYIVKDNEEIGIDKSDISLIKIHIEI